MANNPFFSDAAVEDAVNEVTPLMNSGFLVIYTGTQPTDANQALTGTLLATLSLSATAFGSATASGSAGSRVVTATANSVTNATASNTGTAGYFALLASNGTTVVAMGSVGTSGADLNLSTLSIVSGNTVSITSGTITQTEA
jgi:hypothetical protein